VTLSVLIAIPVLVGIFVVTDRQGERVLRTAAFGSLVTLGLAVNLMRDFQVSTSLQVYVDEVWISQLGIHWALGVDGVSIFMVVLAALAWTVAMFFAAHSFADRIDRPRTFVMLMAVAQSATIGAFVAQDLMLFVLFFDLLLIPFYLLIGMFGEGDRRAATTKFMIYTLAGSLLMFAAAIGLGVAAQDSTGTLSFAFQDLYKAQISADTQRWIFGGFALALLIKMPAVPLHGWMRDTYRATPLPVLIVLSAVVAKLGAYGFIRVVLPLLPEAVVEHQTTFLVISLVAIVYGSVMAFSQDNVRLIVGYSSIAQMGFIGLGIWSLDEKGLEGAILQMVNHGLVVIPLFVIVALLRERAGGSESLDDMGGIARGAPLLATLFLVVALATLAMPGSPNFVGELYILFGAFDGVLVYGLVASLGVALAAVYMIRFFQRSMHNREGTGVVAREVGAADVGLLLPAVLVLLTLAVYPQWMVGRVEPIVEPQLSRVVVVEREADQTAEAEATEEPAGGKRGAGGGEDETDKEQAK
jgi:NADH-quinone oxidoreductase subunit M